MTRVSEVALWRVYAQHVTVSRIESRQRAPGRIDDRNSVQQESPKGTGEHPFLRVNEEGVECEPIVFEIGPYGKATRFWQQSIRHPPMRKAGAASLRL